MTYSCALLVSVLLLISSSVGRAELVRHVPNPREGGSPYSVTLCGDWKPTASYKLGRAVYTHDDAFTKNHGNDKVAIICVASKNPNDRSGWLQTIAAYSKRKGVYFERLQSGRFQGAIFSLPHFHRDPPGVTNETAILMSGNDYILVTAHFMKPPSASELTCLKQMVGSVKMQDR